MSDPCHVMIWMNQNWVNTIRYDSAGRLMATSCCPRKITICKRGVSARCPPPINGRQSHCMQSKSPSLPGRHQTPSPYYHVSIGPNLGGRCLFPRKRCVGPEGQRGRADSLTIHMALSSTTIRYNQIIIDTFIIANSNLSNILITIE